MSAIDRRDFLKLVGAGAAGASAGFVVKESSRYKREQYIPYVATPEDYTPGVASWYKTVCRQCSAGCGIEVRIREGRAKKIEGNPMHPVSQGKSCALGQSALNDLYNPDRLKEPQQGQGERGSGDFTSIAWEQGYTFVAERLAALRRAGKGGAVCLLTGTTGGHMHDLLATFMKGLGSERYLQYDFTLPENLLAANQATYGRQELPYYDIANADFLLSFGADYLSHWLSPVHHSMGYGKLRQSGPTRGQVTQVEPRMSLSGANADHWLPAKPGSEGLIALAIAAHISSAGELSAFTFERAASASGLDAQAIRQLAMSFAAADRPLAIAGGAATHTGNGMANAVAVNILNSVAGGAVVGNPDPVIGASAASHRAGYADMKKLIADMRAGRIEALIVADTNPVFTLPENLGLREAIKSVPLVVAVSSYIDETSVLADIILTPHSALESWGDDAPQPGVGLSSASVAQPVVKALHDTRAFGDIIIELGRRLGNDVAKVLPWDNTYDYLQARWREIYDARAASLNGMNFEQFWNSVLQAGVWAEDRQGPSVSASTTAVVDPGAPDQPGDEFPYYFQPYVSPAFLDGRAANLPWQQELPDPLTGVVYNSWIELNPDTANSMNLETGDVVEVSSASGSLEAPVVVFPAVRPDVVAMPIGQGHSNFGRYASNRGANPLAILDDKADRDSGALAWSATTVSLRATGNKVRLISTSGTPRELGRSILGPYGEGGKPKHDDDGEHH